MYVMGDLKKLRAHLKTAQLTAEAYDDTDATEDELRDRLLSIAVHLEAIIQSIDEGYIK